MREPSVASPPQCFDRQGGASLHGCESESMGFISEYRDPTKWYSKLLIAALALFFFHDSGDSRDLRIPGVPHDFTSAEPFRFRPEKFSGSSRDSCLHRGRRRLARGLVLPRLEISSRRGSVSRIPVEPRRTPDTRFDLARPPVQRIPN